MPTNQQTNHQNKPPKQTTKTNYQNNHQTNKLPKQTTKTTTK
jgi:hypothetical protein